MERSIKQQHMSTKLVREHLDWTCAEERCPEARAAVFLLKAALQRVHSGLMVVYVGKRGPRSGLLLVGRCFTHGFPPLWV